MSEARRQVGAWVDAGTDAETTWVRRRHCWLHLLRGDEGASGDEGQQWCRLQRRLLAVKARGIDRSHACSGTEDSEPRTAPRWLRSWHPTKETPSLDSQRNRSIEGQPRMVVVARRHCPAVGGWGGGGWGGKGCGTIRGLDVHHNGWRSDPTKEIPSPDSQRNRSIAGLTPHGCYHRSMIAPWVMEVEPTQLGGEGKAACVRYAKAGGVPMAASCAPYGAEFLSGRTRWCHRVE